MSLGLRTLTGSRCLSLHSIATRLNNDASVCVVFEFPSAQVKLLL